MHGHVQPCTTEADLPTVLVLAAGAGRRFLQAGAGMHKLQSLCTVRGHTQTVLAHVLCAVRSSGLPCHVVKPEHTAHHTLQGMGTSIATGVAATADATGWLILPADLPWIEAQTLRTLAQALRAGADAVAPLVHGQRGHPVGFAKCHAPALLALRGEQGARRLLASVVLQQVRLNDVGCIWDVDQPADLSGPAGLA